MAVNKLDISMMEDVGTSANQLVQRDGSGNLPAVDGSLVTGLKDYTTSASDPVVSTNPSGGVGTVWYNQTSGEMYICTDATAGANVWTNVGAGSGDIEPIPPFSYQGENYGYSIGGYAPPQNIIEKYSFTSDGNSTNVGDLTTVRTGGTGTGSSTHGYLSGGTTGSYVTTADKWSFSAGGNSTAVGTLSAAKAYGSLQGVVNSTHAYYAGGYTNTYVNVIEKMSFATDGSYTDVGDLQAGSGSGSTVGVTSSTNGYVCGGTIVGGSAYVNVISKFSTVSNANATDVGDLSAAQGYGTGWQTDTNGYIMGGTGAGGYNTPSLTGGQRFSFASESSTTALTGTMSVARSLGVSGSTSTTHGYAHGGTSFAPETPHNIIDKMNLSTEANMTDVGNMYNDLNDANNGARWYCGGTMY